MSNSFFLFGARGSGKSTLLKGLDFLKMAHYIDLQDPDQKETYALRPSLLEEQSDSCKLGGWIVIDEIQKLPKLLSLVHRIIEKKRVRFALSSSSLCKLKRGGADLLAGRAFIFPLFPLLQRELACDFELEQALNWGTLPQLFDYSEDQERSRYLKSYIQTYVKEEVVMEQLIRNLDPFRLFLPIAAQMNAKPINYSNIARDTGADHKTIQKYFQILEETYLGFFLNSFGPSVRKVQIQSPKFYFFDLGVKKAIQGHLNIPTQAGTAEYGLAFETYMINEIYRLNAYYELDYQLSYLRTKDDVEVDLILQRPGMPQALIEIKSSPRIDERHIKNLLHFQKDFPQADLFCLSQVKLPQKIGPVWVMPWREGLRELFAA